MQPSLRRTSPFLDSRYFEKEFSSPLYFLPLQKKWNEKEMNRNKQIIRTSLVGIAANLFLAAFKAVAGWLAGSVAIIMDAVNNLSDALSSVITIVGTKLSEKPADRNHPFGYGRVEYFSAIIISVIVLSTGILSLVESVKKIFNPTNPSYTSVTLTIIIVAIVVKLVLGWYVKKQGQRLKSNALEASGADATFDAVVTLSTLVSAGIMLFAGLNLDGILGSIISLVIIKAGIEMIGAPIGQLLGESIPKDMMHNIEQDVKQFAGVLGVYDVILNYYGPNAIIGSLHVSVPDTMTAVRIHGLTRSITKLLYDKYHIIITVGIYAVCTSEKGKELQKGIMNFVERYPHVEQIHGYFYLEEKRAISFDVVPDDTIRDDNAFQFQLMQAIRKVYPGYIFSIVIDHVYYK